MRTNLPVSMFAASFVLVAGASGQLVTAPHWPAPQRFLTNGAAGAFAVGDVDGDGVRDVVATLPKSLGTKLLGDGFGGLGPQQDSPQSVSVQFPAGVTLADVDGDGDLDRVTALHGLTHFDSGTIWIESNDGSGAFVVSGGFVVANQPQSIRAADVNGDGWPDLMYGHMGFEPVVHVRLGSGGGSFGGATVLQMDDQTGDIEVGDVNGDGELDLVSSGWTNDRFNVRLGDGLGGFGVVTRWSMGDAPFALVLEDFDHDGHLDVAVSNSNSNSIGVRRGLGGAAFGAYVQSAAAVNPRTLASGDLDGDGLTDLVSGGDEAMLFRGIGAAQFAPGAIVPTGGQSKLVEVADMDGDSAQDLVFGARAIGIARGDGAGGFLERAETVFEGAGMSAAFADLNGDGFTDIVGVDGASFTVRLCDGVGGFVAAQVVPLASTDASRPKLYDVDGDHDLDAVVMRTAGAFVLKNDGSGTFSLPTSVSTSGGLQVADHVAADVDGDGDLDLALAVTSGNARIQILANDGMGGFAAAIPVALPAGVHPVALEGAFDADSDGRDDIVVRVPSVFAPPQPGKFYVAYGGSASAFASVATILTTAGVERILLRDVDGDGRTDACVVGTQIGITPSVAVTHIGDGTSFGAAYLSSLGVVFGAIGGVTLGNVDLDEAPELVVGSDAFGGLIVCDNVNGAFGPATSYNVDPHGSFVAIGSVDADPEADAIVVDKASTVGPRIAVLRAGVCKGVVGTHGNTCVGAGGFAPKLALLGCPSAGGSVSLKVRDAYGGPIGILLLGLSSAAVPLGGSACFLNIGQPLPASIVIPLSGVGPGNGTFDATIALPAAIPSVTLHVQLVSPDPSATLGLTTSNALAIVFP